MAKKVILVFLLAMMIVGMIMVLNNMPASLEQFNVNENHLLAQEEKPMGGEIGIINSIIITQRKTGTGPFDSDDTVGNDSSEDNDIVRSFDQVTWTVEDTMKLKDESQEGYKGGIIDVKAELPENCANLVKWDLDSMKWAENASVSADGRMLNAEYTLNANEVTIPGKQTLVFVLKVLGAPNEFEIKPTFTMGLVGNEENEKKSITDTPVKVSAAPNYNVKLVNNGNIRNKVTVNYGEGDIAGRMYGYSLIFQLYNVDANKGLKGIEYPNGDIKLDVKLSLMRTMFGSSEQEDITSRCLPILWNYKINQNTDTGNIANRNMRYGSVLSRYERGMPYGLKTSNRTNSVYKSGNIEMEQDGGIIHTTISNYDFDGIFPAYSYYKVATTLPIFGENVGCFNISYFQIFVPNNEESTMPDRNYYLTVSTKTDESNNNFLAHSISGATVTTQQNDGDDYSSVQHVLYIPGSFNQSMYIQNDGGTYLLGKSYDTGDAKGTLGQYFEFCNKFSMTITSDDEVLSATKFIKFDGKGFEPVLFEDGTRYKKTAFDGDMEFNVWYITKPDGTNWADQTEMNNAKIEDMLYFGSIEDIPEGYICVGEFLESSTGKIIPSSGDNNVVKIRLKIRETATIGKTYGLTATTTNWLEYVDRNLYTITKQNFSEWPAYRWTSGNRNYIKTEYDSDGNMVEGTHSGAWTYGQSLLVVGSNLKLSKTAVEDDMVTRKINYDMGKNEFIANYKLSPILEKNEYSNVSITNVNLKIEDILPKGITYVPGSGNNGEPEIVNNADDSQTLTWYIYGCTVGEVIDPITYKARVNEESPNGKQYESTAVISELIGNDNISKIGTTTVENRTANVSINIINLSSYALYKTTITPIIEVNGDIHYKVTALNKTDDPVPDFQMLDILPYNGDNRGTDFKGTYTLSKIDITQTNTATNENISNDNLTISVTEDEAVRSGVTSKDANLGVGSMWKQVTSGQDINKDIKGFVVKGELPARARLEVDIYLKTSGNRSYDKYNNSATAQTNTETEEMQTPIVVVQDIKRILDGKVWFDSNKDGVMSDGETYLQGVKVTLLNEDGTQAVDISNNPIPSTTTNVNGYYKFEDMKRGKYKVQVEQTDNQKEITKKEVGTNREINSKFNLSKETDVIEGLDSIASPEIKIEYVNAGIAYKDSSVLVHHYLEGTITPVPLKNGSPAIDELIEGKINDRYETTVADVPDYYELVSIPTNRTGIMGGEQTVVTYYYRLKKYPYVVNYLDKDTGEKIDTSKTVQNQIYGNEINSQNEIKTFEKYTYNSVDKDKLIISTTGNEINIYYTKKKGTVTTKYVDINTETEISTQESTTDKVDENYTTNKKNITEYVYIRDSGNTEGQYTIEPIEVIYYYAHVSGGVIEKHVDVITNEILDNKTHTGNEGDEYDIKSKIFEGYDLVEDRLPTNSKGKMSKEDTPIEVVYYYKYKTTVTAKYIDKITGEILTEDVIINGHEADEYATENKTFDNYDLVEVPENKDGKMTKDPIVVTYYYVHKSAGVTENHYDIITGERLTEEKKHGGHEGDDYDIESKSFDGYDLVQERMPTNAKGKMTIEEIKVDYYYKYKSKITVKYIDKITGKEISEEKVIDGHEGDEYKEGAKIVDGYELVEEYPENAEGNMTKEPIEIIYYYKRPAKVIVSYVEEGTEEELEEKTKIEGHEKDEYKTEPIEIIYYKLVEERYPENDKGKMEVKVTKEEEEDKEGNVKETDKVEDTTYVKYYYRKLTFNLKVEKEISKLIKNGVEEIQNSKLSKTEIKRKEIENTTLEVEYTIRVVNDGELAGTTIVKEDIPEGMNMNSSKNSGWNIKESTATLDTGKIEPGETKEYKVVLDWEKGTENFGTMTNIVELIDTENEARFGEKTKTDNIDKADFIISISTGESIKVILTIIVFVGLIISVCYISFYLGYSIK